MLGLCVLRCLGQFQLEQNEQALSLPTRKTAALLTYLVLHPEAHAREHLITLFWGDSVDKEVQWPIERLPQAESQRSWKRIPPKKTSYTISDRISEKKARINKVREKDMNILGGLPTIIACVEFSTPLVRIVIHE